MWASLRAMGLTLKKDVPTSLVLFDVFEEKSTGLVPTPAMYPFSGNGLSSALCSWDLLNASTGDMTNSNLYGSFSK